MTQTGQARGGSGSKKVHFGPSPFGDFFRNWTFLDQNGPKWTKMDQNGPKWTFLDLQFYFV